MVEFNSRTSVQWEYEWRLGLILKDTVNKRVLAITAAQIWWRSDISHDSRVIWKSLGNPLLNLKTPEKTNDFIHGDHQLSVIELDQRLVFSPTQINFPYGEIIDNWRIIDDHCNYMGKDVLIHNTSPAPQIWRLISSNALFRMPCLYTQGQDLTNFEDLMKIKGIEWGSITKKWDPGSLLTSKEWHILWISIGWVDGFSFFAKPNSIIKSLWIDLSNPEILLTS